MANNFDAEKFLQKKSYPAIQMGEHEVTLGKVSVGTTPKEDGEVSVYIVLPITLSNGQTIDVRYYGEGISFVYSQLRRQTDDRAVYDSNFAFFESLEGKTLKCWISQRSYTDKNGKDQTTNQYDFINRVKATVEAVEDDDENVDLII